jgi:hypothetical protein
MQSLTIFGGVDSRYTSVRCLGNSWLSKALISENDFIENMKYLQHTCYNFVSTICLWYKTFKVLRRANPKTLQQHIQLGFLTHTDKTDLLAQFMLDHDKLCNYCMYICMAKLNKRLAEPVFGIAQNHNVLLTDISGQIHPDPVKQFYQLTC